MALHTPAVATSDETRASLENFGAYTASMLPKYIQAAQVTLILSNPSDSSSDSHATVNYAELISASLILIWSSNR